MWPNKRFINSNERIARQFITSSLFYLTNTKLPFIQFILDMFFKSKLVIKNYTQVLLRICTGNFNIVVKDTRMGFFNFFFLEKITSCAGFLGSGLKSLSYWYAHWKITLRPIFKHLADSLRSWTVEKSDISSANSLGMELSPSGRSLKYIKNKRDPRMEPCGTPALIGSQLDSWPFNNLITLWNILER